MTSEKCRQTQCPYFGKFSVKAVCRYKRLTIGNVPKEFIKHLKECPKEHGKGEEL